MKKKYPGIIAHRSTRPKFFWKYFPVLYVLPFIMASFRIESVAQVGNMLRWVFLAVSFLMAASFRFRRSKPIGKADYIIIGFLGFFLISSLWSIVPSYTAQRTVSLFLLYICSFWLLWRYADQFSVNVLVKYLLYTVAVILAVNLLAGAILFPNELFTSRFQGLFVNPNNIGILVSVTLPISAAHWLYTKKRFDFIVTAVLAINLIASGSRSALLAVGCAMVAILVSLLVKRALWAILITIITLIIAGLFVQTTYFDELVLRADTLATASNRTFFWEIADDYIARRPNLGHGFASDRYIHEYYGVNLRDLGLRGYGVMSSYYGMAIQVGWPLTVVFFGLIWGVVLLCIIKYWRDYALVTLGATLMSGLIISIFENTLYSAGNLFSFLFWVWFMLAIRRLRHIRRFKRTGISKMLPPQPHPSRIDRKHFGKHYHAIGPD